MFNQIVDHVRMQTPLVHNITNYVTVNDCANILLACGGSPIMADSIMEVEEITSICNALVINIGTLNERTIEAMILAGKKANELGHPVILDPVGAGASNFRTETTFRLLQEVQFTVIRGNISEIKTIGGENGNTKGVDANVVDTITEERLDDAIVFAQSVSEKTGAIIAITGAIDLVCDTKHAYIIRNGHPIMSKISGTGCMLTAIIGAFCAANPQQLLQSTATAVAAMGLCGELAYKKMIKKEEGTASLKIYLIDYISQITGEILKEGAQIENR